MRQANEIDTPKVNSVNEYSTNNLLNYGTMCTVRTLNNTICEELIIEVNEEKSETPKKNQALKSSSDIHFNLTSVLASDDITLLKSVTHDYDKVLVQLQHLLDINRELKIENCELSLKLEEFNKNDD